MREIKLFPVSAKKRFCNCVHPYPSTYLPTPSFSPPTWFFNLNIFRAFCTKQVFATFLNGQLFASRETVIAMLQVCLPKRISPLNNFAKRMKHTDRSFWLIQFKFIIFKTRFLFIPSQSWQVEIVLYEALFNNTCTWPTHTHLSLLKLSLSLTHTQRQRVFLFLPCNTDLLFQSLSLFLFLSFFLLNVPLLHTY